jgi:thiamine pyrophosphate-dependent acetolactate synthase large subunit-like protein
MTYRDVLECLAEARGAAPVVAGPGILSRLLWACGHHRATLYQMELGYPTAVCLGLALAAPKERVVAVEGDGSLLAGLGVLTTITRYAPPNLIVLVLDNGAYGTVGPGTVTSATRHGTDLVAVARACGWNERTALRVESREQTRSALAAAFAQNGPWLLVARAEGRPDDARDAGQIPVDIVEAAIGFRRDMIERGYT